MSLFFNISNNGYKVGDYADDFYLENVDGHFVSLSDYSDALGFIIVFTCNTCPYSIAYEDRLIDLDKKYKIKASHSLIYKTKTKKFIQNLVQLVLPMCIF